MPKRFPRQFGAARDEVACLHVPSHVEPRTGLVCNSIYKGAKGCIECERVSMVANTTIAGRETIRSESHCMEYNSTCLLSSGPNSSQQNERKNEQHSAGAYIHAC